MEKSLEQLKQEYEKTTVLLEREKRKMQRLKNRQAYLESGSRKQRTHRCNLVRRTEKGRLRRRGWGLRWEKAQKGGKGTNLRGFFED